MMLNTLLLDIDAWDLVLDASGNIALAAPPYALAQDVASSVRTWFGEVYYDTTDGIPYPEQLLGQLPPAALVSDLMTKQAKKVPGVVNVQVVLQSFLGREVKGQIQFVDEAGVSRGISF